MVFSRKKIYLVIALTVASLVGILVVQFFWIDSALQTQEEQFDRNIAYVVRHAEESIMSDPELRNNITDFVDRSANSQEETVPAEGRELISEIKAKIDTAFRQTKINRSLAADFANINYEFGLVKHVDAHTCCRNGVSREEVLLSSAGSSDPAPIRDTKYHGRETVFEGKAHINFHFPNKNYFLAYQIGGMLVLSILGILIIVGCFAYTILTIRKQKNLAEMKNDFINNMTHELKTPIFSISLASKALGKSQEIQQSSKLGEYINLINNESRRLKSQVNKVLELTLADSEHSKIEKEEVNLHELIEKVASNFDLILSRRNGIIDLDLEADKHIIHADRTHLANIIQNLIDNAIKYSREDPHITISTEDREKGVSFSITDNGIGMNSETRKHIFDKFYRARTGDIHEVKGFGLGLSYVKNIVEAHKGRIKLNSKLNKGSTFTIFLPA